MYITNSKSLYLPVAERVSGIIIFFFNYIWASTIVLLKKTSIPSCEVPFAVIKVSVSVLI